MTKAVLIIVTMLISLMTSNTQGLDTLWTRTYGGDGWDNGQSVVEAKKGGFVITGFTSLEPQGLTDVLIIRTDVNGDTIWTRSYGTSVYDGGLSIIETYDHNYVIAGVTFSFHPDTNYIYLIKINDEGDTLWTRNLSTTYGSWVYDIKQVSDSGFVMTGFTLPESGFELQLLMLKTDFMGHLSWYKTYGTLEESRGYSVTEVPGQGFAVSGNTLNWGRDHYLWLLKTDYQGDTLWTRMYPDPYASTGEYLQLTADGGFIITGMGVSHLHESWDLFLIKTDHTGEIEWCQSIGGYDWDGGNYVEQTSDGGYFVGGYTFSYGEGGVDFYFVKTDQDGILEWQKTVGQFSSEWGMNALIASDGCFVQAGNTWSYGQSNEQVYLVKLLPDFVDVEEGDGNTTPNTFHLSQNFPNPFNPSTTVRYSLPKQSDVRIEIYNILGQIVTTLLDDNKEAGYHTIAWQASDFPSGVYFARLEAGGRSENVKMVLLK